MTIDFHPITATLGAEVTGIDMATADMAQCDEIRKGWLEHKVLVLRDQHCTLDEHIAFGRSFGELEIHPFANGVEDHPEIVAIHSGAEFKYAASNWHSDVTWRAEPSMGSILRGVIIPPAGGDTVFADAVAAYERLSPDWKERIEGLTATNDFARVFGDRLSEEERVEKRKEFPVAHHPVVRTHPETGAKAIYTNRGFVTHIDEVSAEESEAILSYLERSIMNPSIQCRIRWQVGTVVMWDNQSTQHFATNDFFPLERRVERVTIVGDKPF